MLFGSNLILISVNWHQMARQFLLLFTVFATFSHFKDPRPNHLFSHSKKPAEFKDESTNFVYRNCAIVYQMFFFLFFFLNTLKSPHIFSEIQTKR